MLLYRRVQKGSDDLLCTTRSLVMVRNRLPAQVISSVVFSVKRASKLRIVQRDGSATDDLHDLLSRRWSGRRAYFRRTGEQRAHVRLPTTSQDTNPPPPSDPSFWASHMRSRPLVRDLSSQRRRRNSDCVLLSRSLAWHRRERASRLWKLWHKRNYEHTCCYRYVQHAGSTFCARSYRARCRAIIHYGRNHKIMRMIFQDTYEMLYPAEKELDERTRSASVSWLIAVIDDVKAFEKRKT